VRSVEGAANLNDYLEGMQEGFAWLRALPWLGLLLYTAPLVMLAAWKQVYPHEMFLGRAFRSLPADVHLADLARSVSGGGRCRPPRVPRGLADLGTLPRAKDVFRRTRVMRIASLRVPHHVSLVISNHSRRPFSVAIRDDVPSEFEVAPEQFTHTARGASRAAMHYQFKSSRRARSLLERVYLRVRSLLRLWRRDVFVCVESEIHVYPDMKQMSGVCRAGSDQPPEPDGRTANSQDRPGQRV